MRAEEQKHYDGMAAAAEDHWLWQSIFAPAEIQAPVQAPHAAAGEAMLRVRLVANSSAPVDPDHHLILSVNGAQIADEKWDGVGPHVITATVPSGVVRPGENTVTLKAPGDTGAPADSAVLDWIELTYPRELVLDEGELTFAGQAGAYDLATSGELAALWDITDPAAPVALSDYERQGGRVRFASDGTPRRFLAATTAGLRQPAAITPVSGGDLRALPGGADLIIVTVPQFRAALEPLVAARQKQGLRVAVVDVEQIYDTFSDGEPGPEAIRAFVQYARTHWPAPAPRYLLLAGDASYDPRGYLGGAEQDHRPHAVGAHRVFRLDGVGCVVRPARRRLRRRSPPWPWAVSPRRPPSSSRRWWPRLWNTKAVIGPRPGAMMLCWWPTTMSRDLRRPQRRSAIS